MKNVKWYPGSHDTVMSVFLQRIAFGTSLLRYAAILSRAVKLVAILAISMSKHRSNHANSDQF
jgi:hypothetical protein